MDDPSRFTSINEYYTFIYAISYMMLVELGIWIYNFKGWLKRPDKKNNDYGTILLLNSLVVMALLQVELSQIVAISIGKKVINSLLQSKLILVIMEYLSLKLQESSLLSLKFVPFYFEIQALVSLHLMHFYFYKDQKPYLYVLNAMYKTHLKSLNFYKIMIKSKISITLLLPHASTMIYTKNICLMMVALSSHLKSKAQQKTPKILSIDSNYSPYLPMQQMRNPS